MDEIVKQAMAKWPNVPHCYGWLALDARGQWRICDERAQALGLPGERITNAALLGFINRNYTHDEQGRWYFQNGPQRVYVDLELTPFVAHTEPVRGLVLHTGETLGVVEAAWMTEDGQLLLQAGERLALLDDRDMAECLDWLRMDGARAEDGTLLEWLQQERDAKLMLVMTDRQVPVGRIRTGVIPSRFCFVPRPRP